jgi:TetR/AcrR family transcriptional regulator
MKESVVRARRPHSSFAEPTSKAGGDRGREGAKAGGAKVDGASPPPRSGREQLLNALSDLMNERESADIPLSDIAERARLNSALVKYYFGNKRGLMTALLARDAGNSLSDLDHVADSNRTASDKLKIHIAGVINLYYRYRYLNLLLKSLMHDQHASAEENQRISDQLIKPAADAQRKILEEGLASGEFKRVDPVLLNFTIMGACDTLFSSNFALKSVFKVNVIDDALRRRYIEHTTAMILNAISTRPPGG